MRNLMLFLALFNTTAASPKPAEKIVHTKKFCVVTVFLSIENFPCLQEMLSAFYLKSLRSLPPDLVDMIAIPSSNREHSYSLVNSIARHQPDVVVFQSDEDFLVYREKIHDVLPHTHVVSAAVNKNADEFHPKKNETIIDATPCFNSIFFSLEPMMSPEKIAVISGPENINAKDDIQHALPNAKVKLLGPFHTWQQYKNAAKSIKKTDYDLVFLGNPYGILLDASEATSAQFETLSKEMDVPTMGWLSSFGRTIEVQVNAKNLGELSAEIVIKKYKGEMLPRVVYGSRASVFKLNAYSIKRNGIGPIPAELLPFVDTHSFN